ncbi:MAG: hypothetical protein AAF745_02405 [Planctomycetota bacterium]
MSTATAQPNPFAPPTSTAVKQPNATISKVNAKAAPLFNEKHIAVASMLATPLAGAILLSHNFSQLGNPSRGRMWIMGALAFNIAWVAVKMVLPETIPSIAFLWVAIGVAMGMKTATVRMMGSQIETSPTVENARWKTFGISVLVGTLWGAAVLAVVATIFGVS